VARRCKIAAAAGILGESERTVRNKAAAGQIPGGAKPFGTWTFDIALLHAFIAAKERETLHGNQKPAVARAKSSDRAALKPAKEGDGHYAQVAWCSTVSCIESNRRT
jgi:hypothetical protein